MFILPQDAAAVAFWAFGDPGPARPWASEGGRFSACFFGGARAALSRGLFCVLAVIYMCTVDTRGLTARGMRGPSAAKSPGSAQRKAREGLGSRTARMLSRPILTGRSTCRVSRGSPVLGETGLYASSQLLLHLPVGRAGDRLHRDAQLARLTRKGSV